MLLLANYGRIIFLWNGLILLDFSRLFDWTSTEKTGNCTAFSGFSIFNFKSNITDWFLFRLEELKIGYLKQSCLFQFPTMLPKFLNNLFFFVQGKLWFLRKFPKHKKEKQADETCLLLGKILEKWGKFVLPFWGKMGVHGDNLSRTP